jgi:hypothetical protein
MLQYSSVKEDAHAKTVHGFVCCYPVLRHVHDCKAQSHTALVILAYSPHYYSKHVSLGSMTSKTAFDLSNALPALRDAGTDAALNASERVIAAILAWLSHVHASRASTRAPLLPRLD